MAVKFISLASGSSGNSVFIGTESTNILIDAGLTGKAAVEKLKAINIDAGNLDAIFVTHEHIDHVKGVGVLSRKYDIPIYATEKTWREMNKRSIIGEIADKNKKIIYIQENCLVNDIIVNAFPIPHDTAAPVGYCVFTQDKKISVATDIGHTTDCIRDAIVDSDLLLIESNHDVQMLLNGPYPQHLKSRVLGLNGHLSNVSCGNLLIDIMNERLKHIFLGHLSEENNHPLTAFETVSTILEAKKVKIGQDLSLLIAPKNGMAGILEI